MASGLAYVHERGVVHRDVKPGNFLLTPGGKLKLSDFGLATVEAAAKITAAGKTMGTFPYMAPEQIRGRPPFRPKRTCTALGCVIFEMLTGQTPFVGDTPAEVMHKHLDDVPPRINDFTSDCPPSLERLVRDLLQKDPNDRPESASIVIDRLNDVTPDLEVVPHKSNIAPAVVPRRPNRSPAGSPRGASRHPVVDVHVSTVMDSGVVKKWLAPVLGALLCLSLAWNIRSLGSLGPNRAEELWANAIVADQPELRAAASKALGELARTSPRACQALISALSDSRALVRASAIDGLMAAGSAGRPALPELIHVQNHDESELVRRKASEATLALEKVAESSTSGHSFFVWLLAIVFLVGLVAVFLMTRGTQHAPRHSR